MLLRPAPLGPASDGKHCPGDVVADTAAEPARRRADDTLVDASRGVSGQCDADRLLGVLARWAIAQAPSQQRDARPDGSVPRGTRPGTRDLADRDGHPPNAHARYRLRTCERSGHLARQQHGSEEVARVIRDRWLVAEAHARQAPWRPTGDGAWTGGDVPRERGKRPVADLVAEVEVAIAALTSTERAE